MKALIFLICFTVVEMVLAQEEDTPTAERQVELTYLLRQDCGSCHGMTLQGGLGPSLLPEALAEKPPEFLVQTILDGRLNTAMPPWRELLTESEITWLVDSLLQGLDDDDFQGKPDWSPFCSSFN